MSTQPEQVLENQLMEFTKTYKTCTERSRSEGLLQQLFV